MIGLHTHTFVWCNPVVRGIPLKNPPIEYKKLLRGVFLITPKPAAGEIFWGMYWEYTIFEGEIDHFGVPNRSKNKGNEGRGRLKVQKKSGAPSGARSGLKPLILGSLPKVGF